jgi:hypothetical protein
MQSIDTGYIRYTNRAIYMCKRADSHRLNSNLIRMFGQVKKWKNLSTLHKDEFFPEPT